MIPFLLELTAHVRAAVIEAQSHGPTRADDRRSPGGDTQFPLDAVAEAAVTRAVASSGLRVAVFSEDTHSPVRGLRSPEWLLVVDPIDGTRPATAGIDGGTVSAAVAPYGHDLRISDVRYAVVRELTTGRALAAERSGAVQTDGYAPGWRPRPSQLTDLERMIWAVEFNGHPAGLMTDAYGDLIDRSANRGGLFVLNSASYAMTRVVTGQFDAYADIGNRIYRDCAYLRRSFLQVGGGHVLHLFPYDIAAATLICETAGVVVTDAYGEVLGDTLLTDLSPENQRSCITAGNPQLHRQLLEAISWPGVPSSGFAARSEAVGS